MKIKEKGFTLIEIIIAIGIIGILSTVIDIKVKQGLNRAKVSKIASSLDTSRSLIKDKYLSGYRYPNLSLENKRKYQIIPTIGFSFNNQNYRATNKVVYKRDNSGGWLYNKISGELYANLPNGAYTGDPKHEIWLGEKSAKEDKRIKHKNYVVGLNVPLTSTTKNLKVESKVEVDLPENTDGLIQNDFSAGLVSGETPISKEEEMPKEVKKNQCISGNGLLETSTNPPTIYWSLPAEHIITNRESDNKIIGDDIGIYGSELGKTIQISPKIENINEILDGSKNAKLNGIVHVYLDGKEIGTDGKSINPENHFPLQLIDDEGKRSGGGAFFHIHTGISKWLSVGFEYESEDSDGKEVNHIIYAHKFLD